MKTTVTFSDFVDAFRLANLQGNFSYDGLRALFDYLEEVERDIGKEFELDPIALCCDYAEADADSIAEQYAIDLSDCDDDDAKEGAVQDYLDENTALITSLPGGVFVYRQF
jgi:hypothetical protein